MYISLSQAAGILSKSEDEVMFLNQQSRLGATVDQDTMAWQFNITEVIKLKDILAEETEKAEGTKDDPEVK